MDYRDRPNLGEKEPYEVQTRIANIVLVVNLLFLVYVLFAFI